VNGQEPHPNKGGTQPPQIPGLPDVELAASGSAVSLKNAFAEEASLSRGATPEELAQDAQEKEHHRNQRFRHHFELIAIVALWIAAAAITLIGGIWLWHMGAPARWRWLTGEDVSHLQSIMTAGLLVGVIGNHFKKRIG
jgi:hypothetical protein